MFKKVIYNTGSQVLGKGITASVTFLVTLLIGKSLGPDGYGEFTKIFVFVGYFYTIVDFGLNTIFIKLAHQKSDDWHNLYKNLIGLRLLMAIFWALSASLIAFLLPYDPAKNIGFSNLAKIGIYLASITIITQALYTSANAFFQKNLRYDLSTIAAVSGALTVLAWTFIAFSSNGSILSYTFSYVLGGFVLVGVAYFLIFKKTGKFPLPGFSLEKYKDLASLSWPIGLALIFNLIYFRIDVFILTYTRNTTEVGLYGLSYQFFEAALTVPIFFANSLYPMLSQIHRTSGKEFKAQLAKWVKILLTFALALSALLGLSAYLIPFLWDSRFQGSIISLQILSAGLPFFFISALLWHALIIYDRQKLLIYIYGLGAVFNLAANLIFIPSFGYIAAAVNTVVSELFIMVLLIIAVRRISAKSLL